MNDENIGSSSEPISMRGGVLTGALAEMADDADVGFLVFFGPAEDELLFRGKFVAGENAGTVEAE